MSYYKKKTIQSLLPGDIILHPLYRNDGLLFLKKYKALSKSIIKHISKHYPSSFPLLIVGSESDLEGFLEDDVHTSSYRQELEDLLGIHQQHIQVPIPSEEYFRFHIENNLMGKDLKILKVVEQLEEQDTTKHFYQFAKLIESVLDSKRLLSRAKRLKTSFEQLLDENKELQVLHQRLSSYHDVLYLHSMNTACISFIIGLTLELSDEDILDLTVAALFADIGFINYPKQEFIDYLNSGRNNSELAKNHIHQSVEIIAESSFCRRKSIVFGILDHHENYNGSGFLNQKEKGDIQLFGRIIRIAQIYDELVGGYLEEHSLHSFDALNTVWSERNTTIDPHILRILIDKSSIYKVGKTIVLPTNEVGVVVGFKDYLNDPLRPIIKKENHVINQ